MTTTPTAPAGPATPTRSTPTPAVPAAPAAPASAVSVGRGDVGPGDLPDLVGLLGRYARTAGLAEGSVTLNSGWDLDRERDLYRRADEDGRPYLSVRIVGNEAQVGPLRVPGTDSGCPGCAETRARIAVDHPLADRIDQPVR
ncbi:hypothetical protein PL81_07605, partial [Streptomyces sp. RSD-27]